MFSKIVKKLKKFNCKIIISSLIPSPVSHEVCHSAFQYTNKKLRKLCQKNSHTAFMNLDNIFLKRQRVKLSYFKNDLVHLNKKGAKSLAKEIKSELSYL